MIRPSHRFVLAGGATAMFALVGCSNWFPQNPGYTETSPLNVRNVQVASANAQGGTFSDALAQQYSDYSNQLYGKGDWVDSDYYGRKGQASARGVPTPPEENSRWAIAAEIPNHTRTDLAAARQRLVTTLNGGATTRAPAVAARAQKSYDCWVTDTQWDWQNITKSPCRADFETAMAELSPPAPQAKATTTRILFRTDRSDLSGEAQQALAQVAQNMRGNTVARVTVVGKTDTVGAAPYNLNLSQRRMETVRSALMKDGVAPAQIAASYTGEDQLNVPTPDNTPQADNRAVDLVVH